MPFFYLVMFRKYFQKQEHIGKPSACCLALSHAGSFLKGICYNGEALTKANVLKVPHVNSTPVLFMSRDYVVLFILENPFFLKASIVLDAVEIKSTSYFIQNMFALNYNVTLQPDI